jgi:hypothetical protein
MPSATVCVAASWWPRDAPRPLYAVLAGGAPAPFKTPVRRAVDGRLSNRKRIQRSRARDTVTTSTSKRMQRRYCNSCRAVSRLHAQYWHAVGAAAKQPFKLAAYNTCGRWGSTARPASLPPAVHTPLRSQLSKDVSTLLAACSGSAFRPQALGFPLPTSSALAVRSISTSGARTPSETAMTS